MKSDYVEEKYIYLLKMIAIFSVACAHTAVIPNWNSQLADCIIKVMSALGVAGVPIFFMISGYLYYNTKDSFRVFVKKKICSIIIPWVFCETVVWFYVVLRKGGISFGNWAKFILGFNHSTYYLSILLLFFLLFWKLRRSKVVMYLCIAISITNIILLGWSDQYYAMACNITFTPYLNPLTWIGYFAIGMLIRMDDRLEKIAKICYKLLPVSFISITILFLLHYINNISWTYFSQYAVINIFVLSSFTLGLGKLFLCIKASVPYIIGKDSYTIYLLHELAAGGIVWITEKSQFLLLIPLRPLINILLVEAGIYLVVLSYKKWPKLRKISKYLLGDEYEFTLYWSGY